MRKPLILFVMLCVGLMKGQTDSSSLKNKPFVLKKFRIGFEFGVPARTVSYPHRYYQREDNFVARRPNYKLTLGYNHVLKNQWYFITALGVSYQETYKRESQVNYTQIVYLDTLNGNPITQYAYKYDTRKSSFFSNQIGATIDLSLQKVYSPFKNEKFKLTHMTGVTIRSTVFNHYNSDVWYFKDSTNWSTFNNHANEHYHQEYTSKLEPQNPTDLQLNLNGGVIHNGKYIQQHVGLSLLFQWGATYGNFDYNGRFFRLYYSISI